MILKRFKVILFDVKCLFTNVPLEEAIDIILNKTHDEKKIETNIPRNIMKDLLYLCTKHVHFTYGGNIYIQIDGVAMTIRPTVGEHIYDISRGSHITIH